ncbi:MAG TPA: copper-containing nitrite reductase [Candidatus Limnocylindrales bacterium]|nr:copper-containing nitrite reductase [Candidatus Limnocylindrales bacterium]
MRKPLFLLMAAALLSVALPMSASAQTATPTPEPRVLDITLRTVTGGDPAMAFVGVGGDIDAVVNPTLMVNMGDTLRVTLVNGDGVPHSFAIEAFGVDSGTVTQADEQVVVEFIATQPGEFEYYSGVSGQREQGMAGRLRVAGVLTVGNPGEMAESRGHSEGSAGYGVQAVAPDFSGQGVDFLAVPIIRRPWDVPPSVGDRPAMTLRVDMNSEEVSGLLDVSTSFPYLTFGGKVPGPFLRVREGDTIEFHLINAATSTFPHSIDLQAVTGPGGGAAYTQTAPGGESSFTFQTLNPGLFVYHCATPSIAHHIASGMYGMILVEPEGGLPPVDREFYVMQGDMYTSEPFGTSGQATFDFDAMANETPTYYVFNGAAAGLTADEYALRANVGETVRIYFGVGGPNKGSAFHVVGEIFDRVYTDGSVTDPPQTNVSVVQVPPGGSAIVEFTVDVPGRYVLVDHAYSRLERGLVGYLYVTGPDQPQVFSSTSVGESAGH